VGCVQSRCMVSRFEIVGKSDRAACGLALAQGLQLAAALGAQLVFIDWCGGGCVVGPEELRVRLSRDTSAQHDGK